MNDKTTLFYLLLTLVLCCTTSHAQDYMLTFNSDNFDTPPDSIHVENLTTAQKTTLKDGDTLHLVISTSGLISPSAVDNDICISPNPMNQSATLEFHNTHSGLVSISVYNMAGQQIIAKSSKLPQGDCSFSLSGFVAGSYIINVASPSGNSSSVILSTNSTYNHPEIYYLAASQNKESKTSAIQHKSTSTIGAKIFEMQYTTGDGLSIIAYFSNQAISVKISPTGDYEVIFSEFENLTVTDVDGNTYGTVHIGNQVWMSENLKVTQYANKEDHLSLEESTDIKQWTYYNYDQKAYCFYDNDSSLGYGALYNYAAATNGDESGNMVQGICPDNWHLPSHDEWIILENYLADNGYNHDGSIGGGNDKIGQALVSPSVWGSGYEDGEIGDNSSNCNSSGFSALPGGIRDYDDGTFKGKGYFSIWWTSTEYDDSNTAYSRYFCSGNKFIAYNKKNKKNGFPVRCVKNSEQTIVLPTLTTIAAINVYDSSAVVSGSIIDNGGELLSARGIVYGTNENINLDNGTVITDEKNIIGNFTINLSELADTTAYYYRAFATNSTGTAYGDELTFTTTKAFIIPPVVYSTITDTRDNIAYKTITIGTQTWMAENIRATQYADGTAIPHVSNSTEWFNLADNDNSPAYCFYDNSTQSNNSYGALYTYSAATRGDTSEVDVQGVCPNGWHLPSHAEWIKLFDHLANNGYNYDGSTGGANMKIAKALSGKTGWRESGDFGDIGFEAEKNNASGFSALPAGGRWASDGYKDFYNQGIYTYWWTSSQIADESAIFYYLNTNTDHISLFDGSKSYGHSVRCVKDKIKPQEIDWHDATQGIVHPNAVTDADGNNYRAVKIGKQIWMAENLAVSANSISAIDGDNDPYTSKVENAVVWNNTIDAYGKLYSNEAAKIACPEGWHLPSSLEWRELEDTLQNMGHNLDSEHVLQATTGWNYEGNGTDNYGFCALPSGYYFSGRHSDQGNTCYMWSSTYYSDTHSPVRSLLYMSGFIGRSEMHKTNGLSVRCVKD